MTRIIEGDWIMEKDEVINEDLIVKGNILDKEGNKYNLTVKGNIKAMDINARDINARNINAMDINARDINARNINARDINAWNINFYAVAFAYQNIKCKSIKGIRENSKYFVLDGEIIIDGVKQ